MKSIDKIITNSNGERFFVKPEAKFTEMLAAQFYWVYSSSANFIAEVSLIAAESASMSVASEWIEAYVPYLNQVPYISGDSVVINIDGREQSIQGYLSMLIVARFIGDYDCVGAGANAGYIAARDANSGKITYRNVKIDPGAAFPFSHLDEDDKAIYSLYGITALVSKKIHQRYVESEFPNYYTAIPLDLLDSRAELSSKFFHIKKFLEYYFQEDIAVQDLLLGSIRYQDIIVHQELYEEMAFTIYKIVNTPNEELYNLIFYTTPEKINEKDTLTIKTEIYEQLVLRKAKLAQIYALEVAYVKILLQTSESSTFAEMLEQAHQIVEFREVSPVVENEMLIRLMNIAFSEAITNALDMLEINKLEQLISDHNLQITIQALQDHIMYVRYYEDKSEYGGELVELAQDIIEQAIAIQDELVLLDENTLINVREPNDIEDDIEEVLDEAQSLLHLNYSDICTILMSMINIVDSSYNIFFPWHNPDNGSDDDFGDNSGSGLPIIPQEEVMPTSFIGNVSLIKPGDAVAL